MFENTTELQKSGRNGSTKDEYSFTKTYVAGKVYRFFFEELRILKKEKRSDAKKRGNENERGSDKTKRRDKDKQLKNNVLETKRIQIVCCIT